MLSAHARSMKLPMEPVYEPRLTVAEHGAGVRLVLAGLAHGDGPTLQQAADDLVARLLSWSLAMRSSGIAVARDAGPVDVAALSFLFELGERAARGEDIRERLFA